MNLFRRVRILKIDPNEPEKEAIDIAADILKGGGLVVFPTETVYGLGANLLDKKAVKRVYKTKKRPSDKPLTIHISKVDTLSEMVGDIPPIARLLIDKFWPGPLTIILNSKDGEKIGFRMPSNKIALSLIEKSGIPVVAPSANLSGNRAPRDIKEVIENLEDKIDMVLDGGPTEVGRESTVVDTTVFPIKILREGAISKSSLKDAWRYEEESD